MNTQQAQSKVWFITGTSSGFGRSLAEELIERGERVVATARDARTLDDLVARAPERVLALQLDVTKPQEIHSAVASAIGRFGAIDVLVNNAGYSVVGALEETSEAELRAVFEAMFFGAVATTQALLPHMRERRAGTIVQITSVGGLITAPGFGPYCAAKHALEAVSEALSAEVSAFGMRVLIVEPGAFRTRLFGSAFRAMPTLPAYAETVGATRAYVEKEAGAQAGDPTKAARAIIDAVDAGAPNLRLPLGADAVSGIRAKLAQVTSDVNSTERVALATAFD
ncbi:MAG TPA: oxidoreductase [Polyangiaceae bacterium]|nr:oxidoreductase [Polyangiaceae bacterium]